MVILLELVVRDQEEVDLNPAIFRQLGDQQTFLLQQLQLLGRHGVRMTDPDIQIGATTLANRGGTAHAVQAEDAALLGDKRRAMGGNTDIVNEGLLIGGQHKTGDTMRYFARDISRQERMVEMKQHRQQPEQLPTMLIHCFQRPLDAMLRDRIVAGYERLRFIAQRTDLEVGNRPLTATSSAKV